MKLLVARSLTLALAAFFTATASPHDLSGLWKLTISDLTHKEISTLAIRFTDKLGSSCSGGDWKQVDIEAGTTSNPKFFPIHDTLTYRFENSELVIGRNGICDSYLRLGGKFNGSVVGGRYYAFGIRGGSDLGEFSLSPQR